MPLARATASNGIFLAAGRWPRPVRGGDDPRQDGIPRRRGRKVGRGLVLNPTLVCCSRWDRGRRLEGVGSSTDAIDSYHRTFGRHIRSCRRARGLTQEALGSAAGLSADTIRRLEHGSISPSMATLRKLSAGFEVSLATLFEAHDLRDPDLTRQVTDMVLELEPRARGVVLRVLPLIRELFDGDETAGDE